MSEDDLIEASPCKLRNGNWGCKTAEPVQAGDTVRIVTRANKQWRAQITQIVWTDDQICICETASENSNATKPAPAQPSTRKTPEKPAGKTAPSAAATSGPATGTATPSQAPDAPYEDLDAMADRAAEQDDEFADVMSAMQEFEQNQR